MSDNIEVLKNRKLKLPFNLSSERYTIVNSNYVSSQVFINIFLYYMVLNIEIVFGKMQGFFY